MYLRILLEEIRSGLQNPNITIKWYQHYFKTTPWNGVVDFCADVYHRQLAEQHYEGRF